MENIDGLELLKKIHSRNNGNLKITNEIIQFTQNNSEPVHPVQKELIEYTNKHINNNFMLTDIGQNQLFTLLLKVLDAKKVIDIGVYSGLSSLTFALSLSNKKEGIVYGLDITNEYENVCNDYWSKAGVDKNIKLIIQDAKKTLNQFIENGEEGTFDFIFIDADKESYDEYYEISLKLIRKGGIIAFDNVLFFGTTTITSNNINTDDENEKDLDLLSKIPEFNKIISELKKLNDKISKDQRVIKTMLPLSDGITLVTKK